MSKDGDKYIDRISKNVSGRLGIPQDQVAKLLGNEQLKQELSYLEHQHVPERIIYGTVSKGIAEAITEGKPFNGIKPEDVARGIYESLAADRKYRAVAQNMLEDGVIDKGDVGKIIKRTEQSSKVAARTGRVLEDLLKKAAIILLLFGGVYYIVKSFSGITGGVIGVSGAASGNVLVGVALFSLALAITHFFIKE